MKASGLETEQMGKELTKPRKVLFTKELGRMTNLMDMQRRLSQMALYLKDGM
jgi:hypothetical protein